MVPRPRAAADIKAELSQAVTFRSGLTRQISALSGQVVTVTRHVDQLLAELSDAHAAEIAATADRLVRP